MEHVDHIAARVTIAACLGAFGGTISAMYKGHIVRRTAGLAAFSCALTATACCTSERLVSNFAKQIWESEGDANAQYELKRTLGTRPSFEFIMTTHAIAGMLGGGLTGALYVGRPLRGIFFITPLMMLVGLGEMKFEEMKQQRLRDLVENEAPKEYQDGEENKGKNE